MSDCIRFAILGTLAALPVACRRADRQVAAEARSETRPAPGDRATPTVAPTPVGPVTLVAPELGFAHACTFAPTFTPDNMTMILGVSVPDCGRFSTIVIAHRRGNMWLGTQVAPFSGRYSDFDPSLSPDGSKLYFISDRPVVPGQPPRRDNDIWVVDRHPDGSWGDPSHLDAPINSDGNESSPTITRDGTLYFASSRAGGRGSFDLYRAHWTDGRPRVENLGPAINTASAEVDPYIDPDERYLVFASDRPGSLGATDLYVSYRRGSSWSPPTSLGPTVNSAGWEFDPRVSRDGHTLYFASDRGVLPDPRDTAWSLADIHHLLESPSGGIGHLYAAPFDPPAPTAHAAAHAAAHDRRARLGATPVSAPARGTAPRRGSATVPIRQVAFARSLLAPQPHRSPLRRRSKPAPGRVRDVPAQYPTIQAAIDSASDGDTVLVAPGRYYENITFRNKHLVVTSQFARSRALADIARTIIDGSRPRHPDSASVVLITDRYQGRQVLEGFTITGGTGTNWRDPRNGGLYREGGGILSEFASPRIAHNIITGNEAVLVQGAVRSAGGGGLRCGNGEPEIVDNVITDNRGGYGGAMVLYYTAALVRNNLIARNSGGASFGGGALWIAARLARRAPNVIENNTIVDNHAVTDTSVGTDTSKMGAEAGRGGALLVYSGGAYANAVVLRNDVIWGNTQRAGGPIAGDTPAVRISYSDVQGGARGAGTIDVDPQFRDRERYTLRARSPAVDAGDPDPASNDPAPPGHPATAAEPAHGSRRNDMGAYGGPDAQPLLPEAP